MRKRCLFFLFLFFVSVSLFSAGRKEERFRVWNFSDKDLIVYFELNDSPPVDRPWYIDMYGINNAVYYSKPEEQAAYNFGPYDLYAIRAGSLKSPILYQHGDWYL